MNYKNKLSQGFTLIELLIVIAILGVLAASLLAFIDPIEQLARGRDAGKKSTIAQLGGSITAYYTSRSAYPTAIATWQDTLLTAGELKVVTANAPIAPGCTAVAGTTTAGLDNNYCYKLTTAAPASAIVYTRSESKSETAKCVSPETVAWILWSSADGGKTGTVCTDAAATQPVPGTLTFR